MQRLLLLLLLTAGLVAPAAAQPDELVVWHRYDLFDTDDPNAVNLAAFIDAYEAETGVTVRYEQVAWDQLPVKLAVAVMSGGEVPDITAMSSQHIPSLLDVDAAAPLDDLLADAAWTEDLTEADTTACVIDGVRVCVMVHVRGGITYYRTDAFPDGFPQAADAWAAATPADYEHLATMYLGRSYSAIETQWYPLILANGGQVFDAEGRPAWATPQTAEVVEFLRARLATDSIPAIAVSGDFSDAEAPWLNGEAAAFRGASWSPIFVPGLRDEVDSGAVQLTGGLDFGDGPRAFLLGDGWVVPQRANNPEAAAQWLDLFMTPDFLAQWSQSQNGIPTLPAAAADARFDTPFFTAVEGILSEQGAYVPYSPFYVESLDALAATLQMLLLEPETDALAALQDAQDEILRRYW